ncbi:hypothetical protein LSH36_414g02021 [Paralvinella palmiformis]|uniref:RRM domain-containing protein n=1 Tax=Paralvinella palmiformis TaxID=53620 RepID=A0AAD9JBT9_9ANNE|nr:hypothetical protein LSH36_414g02021 [Paralvinella palmiformis]
MHAVGPSPPVPQPIGPQMAHPMNIMAGPVPPMMDPSNNNQPLQFNTNKGKPPVAIVKDGNGKDERQNMTQSPDSVTAPVGGIPGMAGPPYAGYMGPMPPPMDGPVHKEIITLKSCVLYPPPPNAPPPSTRERPPGCRTVFVGGLPELMTEDILREIFQNCGPICSIRMSKKNFAHIRFEMEECVERCLYLSGYRIKIENKDEKPNTGRIHVDYAQARDDLYEWECKQRAYAREERHRMRIEEEKFRPPSPPPVVHFSEHEASLLLEKLKSDETFLQAAHVLVTWLERGDCNRKNANLFYSMVQSTNAHIRRILNEKQQLNEEFANMKLRFRQRLEAIIKQSKPFVTFPAPAENGFPFIIVRVVFPFAGTPFSKIELRIGLPQASVIFRSHSFNNLSIPERVARFDEAEASLLIKYIGKTNVWVTSVSRSKRAKPLLVLKVEQIESVFKATSKQKAWDHFSKAQHAQQAMIEWQMNQLKEENDSLKCQLEAYKNEVDLLKLETRNTDDTKDKQIKALQQALQGMQQQLIQAKQKMKKDEDEVNSSDSDRGPPELMVMSTMIQERDDRGGHDDSLLSTFLHVHPFGASLDYIWSYLQRLEIKVRTSELEDLLERYPGLYKQTIYGVGASMEKRWKFIGFEVEPNSTMTSL